MAKTFEQIQDVESVKSIKSSEEWGIKSTKRVIEEENKILEREIALLKKKLETEERKEANRDVSMRPPWQNPFLAASNPCTAASVPIDVEVEI